MIGLVALCVLSALVAVFIVVLFDEWDYDPLDDYSDPTEGL